MKEMKIRRIKNGTVIDHIDAGMALKVVRILGIPEPDTHSTINIAMFVESSKMEEKDIVKIEDRALKKREVNKIALIAPRASICIVENFEVVNKSYVSLPEVVTGIARCSNPNCITNRKEPVETEFVVENTKEIRLRCLYCDRYVEDVVESIA